MREILFRGKRLDNGEWVEGDYEHFLTATGIYCYVGKWGAKLNAVDPDTVGQYTGLNDKHGKKIFEGDIVKGIDAFRRDVARVNAITFCTEDVGSCGCCFDSFTGSGFISPRVDVNSCEVVGNIHDNPELLEEVQ